LRAVTRWCGLTDSALSTTMSEPIELSSRIFVAGHRGMVGSALMRRLDAGGYTDIVVRTRQELDLLDQRAVREFLQEQRPDYIFIAAARVGGILANNRFRADFIYQNLMIAVNLIHGAYEAGVKRLMFLGSSCIYPRECPQPMREEHLLCGPLEPTNEPYAVAKIAGIKLCESYNRQYGTRFLAAMPTNLYGSGDNYDLQSSHVLPALIRKMHEARQQGAGEVMVWGSGEPRREFLYSDELADACVFLMERGDDVFAAGAGYRPLVNVGCGEELSIRELAETVREVVGFTGRLSFDRSKPDGMMRKRLDVSLINRLGWRSRLPLREGILLAYRDYLGRLAA